MKELETEISRIENSYEESYRDAPDEMQNMIIGEIQDQTLPLERSLSFLREKAIRKKAESMGIDIPEEWQEGFEGSPHHPRLSALGKAKLRDAITKKRRESVKWWVELFAQLVGLLIGLIGSLAALFAVWYSR